MNFSNTMVDELHHKYLMPKVQSLQSQFNARGLLHSGNYLQALHDLFISDMDEFCRGKREKVIVEVKSRSNKSYDPINKVLNKFENEVKQQINKYINIFHEQAITINGCGEEQFERIMKELSFNDKLHDKLNNEILKIKADYNEFLFEKSQAQSNSIKSTLGLIAAWIMVVMAIIDLFVRK